jgi:nucleoside-diphosphate kinase
MERTLVMIKPDVTEKKLIGKIIQRIEEAGFTILNLYKVTMTREEAEAFYEVHRDQYFFNLLVDFIISGPCVPMIVEGPDAVPGMRELIGARDPKKAAPGTLRHDFATDGRRNAVHASDSPESAGREINLMFNPDSDMVRRAVTLQNP